MTKTNGEIFREYIEQISNQKHFDQLFHFVSEDCIIHGAPYAGMGALVDDSSGERLIIKSVAQNAPASGRLQVGDEIIHASDANREWKTFEELKTTVWGLGKPGTSLTVTVRRGEQIVEVPITRGRVEGFDNPITANLDAWRNFLQKECPDFKSEINMIIAEGDLVAYLLTNSGTSTEYSLASIWMEAGFVRFLDGKIVEMWGLDDALSNYLQLGFRLVEPVKVKA